MCIAIQQHLYWQSTKGALYCFSVGSEWYLPPLLPPPSPPNPPVPTMLARVPSQPGSLPAGRQNHRSATCSATASPISSFSSSHFILIFISHKTGVDLAPSVAWLLVAICDTISFLHISHLYRSLLRNNANAHPVCKKSVQI